MVYEDKTWEKSRRKRYTKKLRNPACMPTCHTIQKFYSPCMPRVDFNAFRTQWCARGGKFTTPVTPTHPNHTTELQNLDMLWNFYQKSTENANALIYLLFLKDIFSNENVPTPPPPNAHNCSKPVLFNPNSSKRLSKSFMVVSLIVFYTKLYVSYIYYFWKSAQ